MKVDGHAFVLASEHDVVLECVPREGVIAVQELGAVVKGPPARHQVVVNVGVGVAGLLVLFLRGCVTFRSAGSF